MLLNVLFGNQAGTDWRNRSLVNHHSSGISQSPMKPVGLVYLLFQPCDGHSNFLGCGSYSFAVKDSHHQGLGQFLQEVLVLLHKLKIRYMLDMYLFCLLAQGSRLTKKRDWYMSHLHAT